MTKEQIGTVYKIQYYKERDHSLFPNRRSMLVVADDEDQALEYVQENAEGFDGFPWGHTTAVVVRERELHTV